MEEKREDASNARERLNNWIIHAVHVENRRLPKRAETLGDEFVQMNCAAGEGSSPTSVVSVFSETILDLDRSSQLRIDTVALLIELLTHSEKTANSPCITKISSVLYSDLEFLYCYIMYYDLRFVIDTVLSMRDAAVADRWGYIYMSEDEKLELEASLLKTETPRSRSTTPSPRHSRKAHLVRGGSGIKTAKSLRLSLGNLRHSLGNSSPLSFRHSSRSHRSSTSAATISSQKTRSVLSSLSDNQISSRVVVVSASRSAYPFSDSEEECGGDASTSSYRSPPPPPSSPVRRHHKDWHSRGSQTERTHRYTTPASCDDTSSHREDDSRRRGGSFFRSLTRPLRGLRQSPSMMNLPSFTNRQGE